MKIIIGLGNPGSKYQRNRHNIGFRCLDSLAARYSIKFNKRQGESDTGRGIIEGHEVILAKPLTFVNLSGNAVARLQDKFHLPPEGILIVHDDLDLQTGRIRIRLGGKSGGHRGVKSIIQCLGNEAFYRIRIGISRPSRNTDSSYYDEEIVDYVLGNLTADEENIMQSAISKACEAIVSILTDGAPAAMNKFNRINDP